MLNENERNESFIFYGSFYEAANKLPEGTREKYLYKLLGYMTYGIEPTFTKDEWMQEALFISHRPQIDINNKRRQSGKKGGAPYKNTNAEKQPMVNFENNKKQPMVDFENNKKQPNDNVNDNVNENENERGGQAPAEAIPTDTQTTAPQPSSPKKQTRFVKPTVEEVAAYCKQRGNNIDAAAFVNFYESKGWYIGKNKMQNWHAAVYTWEKRAKQEQERTRASPQNKTHNANYDFNTAGDIGAPLF